MIDLLKKLVLDKISSLFASKKVEAVIPEVLEKKKPARKKKVAVKTED